MYIKNISFTDEDTLLEMLFDFSLGAPELIITQMIVDIDKSLAENDAYIKYRDSLPTEDDKDELYAEERDLILAEKLMARYKSFEVLSSKLYAIDDKGKTLLYEIDLV